MCIWHIVKFRNVYVYSLSAEHCFRLRNNAISDERVRDCALSTHSVFTVQTLTRAPLGYFYNAPHWGGGGYFEPPSDLRNNWTDSKNSNGIWKPWKNCRGKTIFIDLGVTSDVTGQVKVKMFDISGLVTSASRIAMLSTNKANQSAWIVSLTFLCIIYCALRP